LYQGEVVYYRVALDCNLVASGAGFRYSESTSVAQARSCRNVAIS
jgi:hypothetical protein